MKDIGTLRINIDRLMGDVYELASFGALPEGGITRGSFSPEYQRALDWLKARMEAAGLQTRVDAVGNLIGRIGPAEGGIVMTGSHVDTVRNAGPLDGTLGVLAGIEVARVISENGIELKAPYEVVAFVDEEGVYLSLLGSMAMAGLLTEADIAAAKDSAGKSLVQAMAEYGFDAADFEQACYPEGAISKYIELHIEQGPVLENLDLDIGVVDGIVCQRNIDYRFTGVSNHAGTTPIEMRKDAFRAAADFVTQAYAMLDGNSNRSTRITFGTVEVKPNSPNVIPREATVRMDNRDLDEDNSRRLTDKLANLAHDIGRQYGVGVEVELKCTNEAALMAPGLIESIKHAAETLGYGLQVMASGAGHDAQAIAKVCDAGMIFVPSIKGLSHHPDEWTEPKHLAKGANVLLQSLLAQLVY